MKRFSPFDRRAPFRLHSATLAFCGVMALGSAQWSCSPTRISFLPDTQEVETDVASVDVFTLRDSGIRTDATGIDAPNCDPDLCDSSCLARGARRGTCRANVCLCEGSDAAVDANLDARSIDAQGSGVRGCSTPDECPASQYCASMLGCVGAGFCAQRQELDPSRCLPDPLPSCGCDGRLYPSACARTSAGVRQDPARRCLVVGGDSILDGG